MSESTATARAKKKNQINNLSATRKGYEEKAKSFLNDYHGYLSPMTSTYLDIKKTAEETFRKDIQERNHTYSTRYEQFLQRVDQVQLVWNQFWRFNRPAFKDSHSKEIKRKNVSVGKWRIEFGSVC